MVMPRSRSMSIESRNCSRMSRGSTAPHSSRIRSDSVVFPWSMWLMMAKFRVRFWGITVRPLSQGPTPRADVLAPGPPLLPTGRRHRVKVRPTHHAHAVEDSPGVLGEAPGQGLGTGGLEATGGADPDRTSL